MPRSARVRHNSHKDGGAGRKTPGDHPRCANRRSTGWARCITAAWPRPRTATTANTVALVRLPDSRGAPEPCAADGAATTQSPHQPIRPLLTGGALLRHSAPVRPSAVAWSRCATEILCAKPCPAELRKTIRRRWARENVNAAPTNPRLARTDDAGPRARPRRRCARPTGFFRSSRRRRWR